MNPGTVNKLEEELRKSRRTENPDLQPPAEGWAAISKRLQEAGVAATPGQSGGETPPGVGGAGWAWPTVIGGILLAAGLFYGSYALGADKGEKDAELMIRTEVLAADPEDTRIEPEPIADKNAKEADKLVATDSKLVITQEEVPASSINLVGQEGSEKKADPILANPQPKRSDGVIAIPTIPTKKLAEVQLPERESVEPARSVAEVENAPVQIEKNGAEPEGNASPGLLTAGPAKSLEEVVLPLKANLFRVADKQESFGHLPAISSPVLPEYSRNGKLKVRPELQLHASLSGHYVKGYEQSLFFDRDVGTGGVGRLFILPSGEAVPANFRSTDIVSNFRKSIRLDIGINRQTSSGFLWRVSTGLYYSINSRPSDNFEGVANTEIRQDYYARRFIIPLETGLQFTFRKRKRFRPYLGINIVSYLHNDSVERTSFFDGQTQEEGLVGQFASVGITPEDLDISFSTGFQYKLTQQWSAGLSLYAHAQGNYFIESPFGIEVRYSLK